MVSAALTGVMLAVAAPLVAPARAPAAPQMASIIEDDGHLLRDPMTTLTQFRLLGASVARVFLPWADVAPQPTSRRQPTGFDATDPSAYPVGGFARWDAVVRDAAREGITVDLVLTGGSPRWASGPGMPREAIGNINRAWKPDARAFGDFVAAVGERYSGTYPDPENPGQALPRVSFWSLWNEPNFGEDLAPQAIRGSTIPYAPRAYRALAGAAWSALQATGHTGETILLGEVAAHGETGRVTSSHPQGLPGNFAMTKPIPFLKALYCLGPRYRQVRGATARNEGCPTTRAGSARFPAANPVLFQATGFADHPYSGREPPNARVSPDPDYAAFPDLRRLGLNLDRAQRAYGSRTQLPIYSDEFGYITDPPNTHAYPSPQIAAGYLNWAEYLSWRNPRIRSTMQYLLYDPPRVPDGGGFATGLLTPGGTTKPTYGSYRLPLFLPRTLTRPGRALEVWGCVRPAHYAAIDTGLAQTVRVQFRRPGTRFEAIATIPVTNPSGYFDTRITFPSTGTVRLAWSYPHGDQLLVPPAAHTTVFSRYVRVTIR